MIRLLLLLMVCCGYAQNPADNNRKPVRQSIAVERQNLLGRWTVEKIVTHKREEIPAEKVSGSYFVFNDDGTYTALIMGVEEAGTWRPGPENRSIFMYVDNMKTIWNILIYSANELVLQKGVRGNTVTFIR